MLEIIQCFVGQAMACARKIVFHTDEDDLLYGIAFQFDSRFLILKAESNNDTVSVHESSDVEQWLNREADSNALSLEPRNALPALEGELLTNVWQCQSADNYTDAIDFGFGDLNYPVLKVFCITSELHLMSIGAMLP